MRVVWVVVEWLIGIGLGSALTAELLRWRVDLYMHCIHKEEDTRDIEYSYTCAIHNAEDDDLEAPFGLEIAFEDVRYGINKLPHVYCGTESAVSAMRIERRADSRVPQSVMSGNDTGGREVLVIEAEGIRSKETWFIRFGSFAVPGHVVLRLVSREGLSGNLRFPLVKDTELMPRHEGGHAAGSGTRRVLTVVWASMLGSWLYMMPIVNRRPAEIPGAQWFAPLGVGDLLVLISIVVLAIGLMKVSWRKRVPFLQGYMVDQQRELGARPGGDRSASS